MPIEFYNPPQAILASGTKDGVELGGNKVILSIDSQFNLFNEGIIYTEMSWAEFYKEEGLEDQIDTFTTQDFNSVREDPQALVKTIVRAIVSIIKNQRLFYGVADFEVDAFMNANTVIPGLKLDKGIINNLMEAHKKTRDENLFPSIMIDKRRGKRIKLEFQGKNKKSLHFFGGKIEDFADKLNLAKGFATGILCTSRGAANLYIMNDTISFKEQKDTELTIDRDNITIIEMGIEKELLFPISWFRIDLGVHALHTLELWDEIKDVPQLKKAMEVYDQYITKYVLKKFGKSAQTIGRDLEDDFSRLSVEDRAKALSDMAGAIKKLTEEYKK